MASSSLHITCPSCDAVFKVDPASIGNKTARRVRCAVCRHIWTEKFDKTKKSPTEIKREEQKDRARHQDPPSYYPNIASDTVATPSDTEIYNVKALGHSNRGLRTFGRIFGLPLVLVTIAGLIFWFGKDEVAERFPQSQAIYTWLGIPLSNQAEGFALINQTNLWKERDNGDQELVITADLKNIRKEVMETPNVRVNLFDANGNLIRFWVEPISGQKVNPGESIQINTSMIYPPDKVDIIRMMITPKP